MIGRPAPPGRGLRREYLAQENGGAGEPHPTFDMLLTPAGRKRKVGGAFPCTVIGSPACTVFNDSHVNLNGRLNFAFSCKKYSNTRLPPGAGILERAQP
jgi:hypothetical protein